MDGHRRLLPSASTARLTTVWLVSALAAAVVGVLLVPPGPVPAGAPLDSFSAVRALALLDDLAVAPRPSGTAENVRVRGLVVATLEDLGLEPRLQTVRAPDWYGASGGSVDVVNVLARIPGTASTGTIALVAHYDTLPTTPGANDDGAGVAAVLETARALVEGAPVANDVLLLLTDGEEPEPRFGSSAFVAAHPWAGDVALVLNLEAAGCCGPSLLVETSGESTWLVDRLVAQDPRPAAHSLLTGIAAALGGAGSDIDPFRDAGVPGLSVAHLDGGPVYHTRDDTVERVSPRSLQHLGDHALSFARVAGGLDLATVPGPEAGTAYVSVGPLVLRYGGGWRWPLLALVIGVVAVALGRIARSVERPLRSTLLGGLVAFAAAVLAGVVATSMWLAATGAGAAPGPVGSRVLLALVLAGSAVVWWATARASMARIGVGDPTAGLLLLWASLAAAAAVWFPAAGPWFTWPTLAAGVAVAWSVDERWHRVRGTVLRSVVVAVPTAVVTVPAVDVLWQLVQPRPGHPDAELVELAGVVALLAVLAGGLVIAAATTAVDARSAGPRAAAARRVGDVPLEAATAARVGAGVGVLLGGLVASVLGLGAGVPLVAVLVAGAGAGAVIAVRRAVARADRDRDPTGVR